MVNDSVKPVSALEKARLKKGFYSAKKFVHHVNVPESTYRDHETHPHRVKGKYLPKYAQALGVTEAELITPTPQLSADVESAPQLSFSTNTPREEIIRAVKKIEESLNRKLERVVALKDLLDRAESAKQAMLLVPELTGLLDMRL